MMRTALIASLEKRLRFYADLAERIDDETVQADLPVPGHRSLGLHLWCVVGARESYAKSIIAGEKGDWSSSVAELSRGEFIAKLATSGDALLEAVRSVTRWTPERDRLLLEVAEHEVMHEGQIIRLMLGLRKPVPASSSWAVCG